MATPLHIIPVNNGFPRACIACARQYKHLRLLCKNTPRYSLYTDLMKILEIDVSKLENIRCKLYICDRCICLTQRVNSLREPCQTHVNNLMKIEQSRRKRMLMHSASPNVRIENGSYGRIETGTPRSETEKANISLKFLQKMPSTNQMAGPRQSENQEAHSKVLTGKINLSDHVHDTITDQREINRDEERNKTDRPRNETKKSNILLKFTQKVPTTDQIIDTKSCQSGNQVADSMVLTGEIKLEDHMYAVTCCTDQPELSSGKIDTNRPRYETKQSNFLHNFPKIVSNTEQMVGTHQSEILKADSKVSTWENKLLDHVYDATTDRLATNGGEERKETDRPRNETKKAIILLQFPKKGPSTNQIVDTKSCQSENRVADSKVSTGDIKLVDHVYAASCSTDQSGLSPSEKRKDTEEHRNETKQSKVSLNFPKKVPDTEQTVGTHQSENQKADSKVSTGDIKVLDHEYAADSCRDTADIYKDHSILKSFITESIPSNEIETLSKLSTTKSDLDSRKVSSKIMQLPHVSTAIRNLFLNEITFKMDRICGVRQKSVLVSPVCELNDKTYFNKIINEMEKRCPFILDILIAMCSPAHFNLKDTNYTVAAMYSMAMHSRNPKLKTAFKRKRAAFSKKRHGGNNTLDLEATPLEESVTTVGKRHLCDCGYATINKSNFNKHKKRCSQSTLAVSKMSSVPAKKRKTNDKASDRLVWVDLEMTGLTADTDHILEMACLITDSQLNVIAESADLVIHQPDTVLDSMGEWCKKHHGQSGLTDAVKRSQVSLDDARKTMVSFVREYTAKGSCPLAGNTVHADKAFLVKYMPDFMEHLHYRIVDVSTIKELCRRWYPEKFNKAPKKAETHRALDDIKESIEELKYYRKTIFIEKDSS